MTVQIKGNGISDVRNGRESAVIPGQNILLFHVDEDTFLAKHIFGKKSFHCGKEILRVDITFYPGIVIIS